MSGVMLKGPCQLVRVVRLVQLVKLYLIKDTMCISGVNMLKGPCQLVRLVQLVKLYLIKDTWCMSGVNMLKGPCQLVQVVQLVKLYLIKDTWCVSGVMWKGPCQLVRVVRLVQLVKLHLIKLRIEASFTNLRYMAIRVFCISIESSQLCVVGAFQVQRFHCVISAYIRDKYRWAYIP